ncbi:MAG: hypothetical protein QOD99_820 [Chthoniobacter sp.]|jgi:ankyrin repeat protein|nr:hypothetical protein [Chthoniobacter sp.]
MRFAFYVANALSVIAAGVILALAVFGKSSSAHLPKILAPTVAAVREKIVRPSEPPPLQRELAVLGGDGANYLLAAAARGDLARVEGILRGGFDVNSQDPEGRTALLCAACFARATVVEKLLAAGADPNLADREGHTPLMAAAAAGDLGIVTQLLQHEALMDSADTNGHTPFHYAVAGRRLPVVETLLAHNAASTRADANGESALGLALQQPDRSIVRALISALPSQPSWNASTREALSSFIADRDLELGRILLAKHAGAPALEQGRQGPLAYAIADGDLERLRFLLDCGVDPNEALVVPAEKEFLKVVSREMLTHYLTSERGMTPLMLAAGLGRVEMVQTLVDHGARRFASTEKYQLLPLTFAAWAESAPAMLALFGKDPRLETQENRIEISLNHQRANLFKNNQLSLSTRISTGKPGHDTPTGAFVVTDKHLTHNSTIYKVAMPFFMRLNCREFGMHAGVVPDHPASHGCIRVPEENARELFKQVELGTLVVIAR